MADVSKPGVNLPCQGGVTRFRRSELNRLPQLDIGRAFAVQDSRAIGGVLRVNRRQEDGLYAFRVDWHGMLHSSASLFHAHSAAEAVEKSQKSSQPPRASRSQAQA